MFWVFRGLFQFVFGFFIALAAAIGGIFGCIFGAGVIKPAGGFKAYGEGFERKFRGRPANEITDLEGHDEDFKGA